MVLVKQPSGRTVLIVDDEQSVLACLRFVFELCGHSVLTATDEATAVAHLETWHVDAVLIDVRIPARDGFETWRTLRRSHSTL